MAEEKDGNKETVENQKNHRERPSKTPIWEWIIAAAGLILVVGTVGTTLYRALAQDATPPQLAVSIGTIESNGDGYLVKFTIKNTGSQTAAAAAVEGELKNGEQIEETSSATLTYVPANSARRGGLFFTKNPRDFDLQIRATGYEEP